jgi:hypothetical protein
MQRNINKRILLGCYEVPDWGGSSTVLYLLFERMQRDGLDVAYVNLVSEKDEVFLRHVFGDKFGNPRTLENVHTCILKAPLKVPLWRAHNALTHLIEFLAPDLLFGFGLIAARLFQLAAPRIPVVFMTAGSRQLGHLLEIGAVSDFLNFKQRVEQGVTFRISPEDPERKAVENAHFIVIHSPLIRFAYDHFFPSHAGKIYTNVISVADFIFPEADRFSHLKRPSAEREIDAIFVASQWSRPEKNYSLLKKIVSRCRGLNVHVVGDVDRPCPSAQHHGVIIRRENVYDLLGRSKSLVCPSLLDAAPGVLFEASAMDCNVIASPNCGNWRLCNEQLVATNCSADAFLNKIELSLTRRYNDYQEQFRGGYKDLLETLSVL